MMKKAAMAVVLSGALCAGTAQAGSGIYVAGKAGASWTDIHSSSINWGNDDDGSALGSDSFGGKSKVVGAGGIALGYNFADQMSFPVRVELEYTLRGEAKGTMSAWSSVINDETGESLGKLTQRVKARSQTALVNAYYDISTGTALTPYVMAGMGISRTKLSSQLAGSDETRSDSDTNFAWTVGAGMAYAVSEQVTVDLTARYYDAGDVKAYDSDGETYAKASVRGTDLLLGVRYAF